MALHITGAGGVGKTTLLHEYARVAHEAGRHVVRIDGRNIEASSLGFIVALSQALGATPCDLSAVLERWPAGGVLLVDTYERLAPLDEWLRDTMLPQLPARSVVVIAGRHDPATAWRTNLDWAALTRVHSLGNLRPDESRTYLTRCGVPVQQHEEALAFTRGHPLALSLTADVLTRGDRLAPSRLDAEPEIVRLLIEKFVQEAPSREHRLALHACVTARALTEPLLAAALDQDDVHELFEWLGHLSFVESGPYGLFPHDLARDVVYMDFRWRDPEAAYRITERLLSHLYDRLERTQGLDQLRVWFDLIYPQRYNAHLRAYIEWEGFSTSYAETACAANHDAILGMVERHEGPESAAIARYWLERQPDAFLTVRNVTGELIGFACHLRLDAVSPADLAADPAAAQRDGARRATRPARRWRAHDIRPLFHARRAISGTGAGAALRRARRSAGLRRGSRGASLPSRSRTSSSHSSPSFMPGALATRTSRSAAGAMACSRTTGASRTPSSGFA